MLQHESYRSTGLSDEAHIPPDAGVTAEQFAAELEEAFGPAEWTPDSVEQYEAWLAAQSEPTDAQRLETMFREVDERDKALAALLDAYHETLIYTGEGGSHVAA